MSAAPVVTLIGVALTVVVIALYLIGIALILKRVHARLVTILGAVVEVSEKSAPAGDVIAGINADLARGHSAVGAAVERLQERAAADDDLNRGGDPLPAARGGSVATAAAAWQPRRPPTAADGGSAEF